jgi:hypothetical protein
MNLRKSWKIAALILVVAATFSSGAQDVAPRFVIDRPLVMHPGDFKILKEQVMQRAQELGFKVEHYASPKKADILKRLETLNRGDIWIFYGHTHFATEEAQWPDGIIVDDGTITLDEMLTAMRRDGNPPGFVYIAGCKSIGLSGVFQQAGVLFFAGYIRDVSEMLRDASTAMNEFWLALFGEKRLGDAVTIANKKVGDLGWKEVLAVTSSFQGPKFKELTFDKIRHIMEGKEFDLPIKILVDEGHSEWLTTKNAKSLLKGAGEVSSHKGKLDANLLSKFDVLVIGTAWGSFDNSELLAIKEFVAKGGRLLLTGLGWSWVDYHPESTIDDYPMNKIASMFGAFFNPDIICDPTDNTGHQCSATFAPVSGHPIASGGIKRIGSKGANIGSVAVPRADVWAAVIGGDADAYSTYHESPYKSTYVLVVIGYEAGSVVILSHEGFLIDDHIEEYDNKILGRNIFIWLWLAGSSK